MAKEKTNVLYSNKGYEVRHNEKSRMPYEVFNKAGKFIDCCMTEKKAIWTANWIEKNKANNRLKIF